MLTSLKHSGKVLISAKLIPWSPPWCYFFTVLSGTYSTGSFNPTGRYSSLAEEYPRRCCILQVHFIHDQVNKDTSSFQARF
ncbi:hypothetical protein MJ561_19870 [Klebsiella pneumoniae]|nr:hypothetical protein MJ561_19870 [Klebsiella pneumoniae]